MVETENGPESVEATRALDLLVAAQLKNGKAAALSTLVLAERVVHAKERHRGYNELDFAVSLANLGALRTERGEFSRAVSLHERALSIRRRALGSTESIIADSLDDLALPLILAERFRDAKQKLEESRRIRERAADVMPLKLAGALRLIALLHRSDGNYQEASGPLDRALEIQGRLAPNHPDTASTRDASG